jgi:hypothetical protein
MMSANWPCTSDGRYWLDVGLGNLDLQLMVDTGIIDPLNQIGVELDPAFYDTLKRSGQFRSFRYRTRRDASGTFAGAESGLLSAQLIDPISRTRIGPMVRAYASRLTHLPSRTRHIFVYACFLEGFACI